MVKNTTFKRKSAPTKSFGKLPFLTKKFLITLLIVGVFLLLIYFLKTQLVAATVNGNSIYRFQVINNLEKENGKRVLDELITKELLAQEAERQNINISEQDVENQIKLIEENVSQSGQDLDSLLALQGLTRDKLKENIRLQILAEKMVEGEVEVSKDEVESYLQENQDAFPESTNQAELENLATQQLRQQKISLEIGSLIESLRQNSTIEYIINY